MNAQQMATEYSVNPSAAELWRRRVLWLATVGTLLTMIHHVDHTVRGNHVGWPVVPLLTPYTASFLVYPVVLPGLYFTYRRRLGPRFWIALATVSLLFLIFVHFSPSAKSEHIADIYFPYADPATYCAPSPPVSPPEAGARFLCNGSPPRPWLGVLAVANMLAVFVVTALVLGISWSASLALRSDD